MKDFSLNNMAVGTTDYNDTNTLATMGAGTLNRFGLFHTRVMTMAGQCNKVIQSVVGLNTVDMVDHCVFGDFPMRSFPNIPMFWLVPSRCVDYLVTIFGFMETVSGINFTMPTSVPPDSDRQHTVRNLLFHNYVTLAAKTLRQIMGARNTFVCFECRPVLLAHRTPFAKLHCYLLTILCMYYTIKLLGVQVVFLSFFSRVSEISINSLVSLISGVKV